MLNHSQNTKKKSEIFFATCPFMIGRHFFDMIPKPSFPIICMKQSSNYMDWATITIKGQFLIASTCIYVCLERDKIDFYRIKFFLET